MPGDTRRVEQVQGGRRWWSLSTSELWLALVVLVGAAYFHGSGSWNQNARLDAIFAFVEPGPERWTFRIDSFLPDPAGGINTGDWSRVDGHYYANKAPGTLLLGALVYLPVYALEVTLGADFSRPPLDNLNAHLINVCVSVLPLSVALVYWSRLLGRQTAPVLAVQLSLLTFFGTALLPYATQLWGHTTSAAFVMLGVCSFDAARTGPPRAAVATGALLGAAVTCDLLALPVLVAITLALAARSPRCLPWLFLGGSGPAALLLGYQWYCFGDPLQLPTEGTNELFIDQSRVLGLFGGLSGDALFHLTLGRYRGVFFQMPVLLLSLLGYLRWWRRDRRDSALWVCLGGSLATLLWIATFNGWHGGASVCARYLLVCLPLLALGLRELPRERSARVMLLVLGLPSLSNMLAIAAVSPLADSSAHDPLAQTYELFWSGALHPYVLPIRLQQLSPEFDPSSHAAAYNWGEALGLTGLVSVLPWLLLVAAGSVGACLTARAVAPTTRAPGQSERTP